MKKKKKMSIIQVETLFLSDAVYNVDLNTTTIQHPDTAAPMIPYIITVAKAPL
jgi:desulfoferrodoxin (superoxide reductase-like protein)